MYNIIGIDQRTAVQFFFTLLPSEEELFYSYKINQLTYDEFYNVVKKRIALVLWTLGASEENEQFKGTLLEKDINIRRVTIEEVDRWLAIVRFREVYDIDEDGLNTDSVFTKILHGNGYAELNLSSIPEEQWNESDGSWADRTWTLWNYSEDISQWPPAIGYTPFIRPNDYKEFEKHEDDLGRCLEAFKRDLPTFLRKNWQEQYEPDIQKIENSHNPIETFNKCINFPSNMSEAIIDDLFSGVDDEALELLSDDTYSIFGYFYGIHLH